MTAKETIQQGKAILGIEFGSTRIKAVLIDQENKPIAQGSHEWENQLVDGLWTYSVEAIWYGLQDCYANLRKEVLAKYDCDIEILAGGTHHSAFSYDITAEYWEDFAEMLDVECINIDKDTTISGFKNQLRNNEVYYMLNKALK